MGLARRVWRFLRDVKDAYFIHRAMGQRRRLRALAKALRTARSIAAAEAYCPGCDS
jgi:hypothetical protein